MTLTLGGEAVNMGWLAAGGRVLGDIRGHSDLEMFQHSSESVCVCVQCPLSCRGDWGQL
jgi:hypothetical protein